jgi:hypothetical protein
MKFIRVTDRRMENRNVLGAIFAFICVVALFVASTNVQAATNTPVRSAKANWSNSYSITFSGATSCIASTTDLTLSGITRESTLKIVSKKGIGPLQNIPNIIVNGNMCKMYIDGNITGTIVIYGFLNSLTIRNGCPASISTSNGIGSIKIDESVDTQYSSEYASTSIYSTPSSSTGLPVTKLSLVGASIDTYHGYLQNSQISISSKKWKNGSTPTVSYGGLNTVAWNSGNFMSLSTKGGMVYGDVCSTGIVKSVTANHLVFNTGSIWGGWVGDLGGSIPNHIYGGYSGWTTVNGANANTKLVGNVYGSLGIYTGIRAGYDSSYTESYIGGVGSVGCSALGLDYGGVNGGAYINSASKTPCIKGDKTALGTKFTLYTN